MKAPTMKCLLAFLFVLALLPVSLRADERPNIVWILSEDNSVHYLGLYQEPLAKTPAIEQLASQGMIFDHAFSCAPVCSVARTTLMSGVLAPRAGFQFHRKQMLAKLPDNLQLFPSYLREAGYYTTNLSKKDYNVEEGKVWDASSKKASWRNRPTEDTPFFHMQSIAICHESSLHFPQSDIENHKVKNDPAAVTPAPYHPDNETFRFTQARYIDQIQKMDQAVGDIVDQLRQDDLLDNTLIFYFGDHGGVLPRSKGYLYETGLHVPLIVFVPEKWRKRLGVQPGEHRQGFVSFIDLGPTVLNLADLPIPDTMDGRPILGKGVDKKEVESRDTVLGYADRFDEKSDFCRSIRVGDWKYIRNFQPYLPDGLNNNYRYKQLAYSNWRDLFVQGKLNKTQSAFFEPKPVEALYDLQADPYEVSNLANSPEHASTLAKMRSALTAQLKSLPDLSFYPESEIIASALPDGASYGQKKADEIRELIDIANLAVDSPQNTHQAVLEALNSENPWKRYWGVMVTTAWPEVDSTVSSRLHELLDDPCAMVRVRAVESLCREDDFDPRPTLYKILENSNSPSEVLLTLNAVVYLRDHATDLDFDLSSLKLKAVNGEVERFLAYLALPSPF
jgi:arylsulfatase A-like enzyme